MQDKNNEIPWYLILISIIISFFLGFYMCKLLDEDKKNFSNSNLKIRNYNTLHSSFSGIDLEEEKGLEDYKNCLENSRYYVEEAKSYLKYPEDYGGCDEALEKALDSLEETYFCGL